MCLVADLVTTAAPRTSVPASSLLDRLRIETRSVHERLERDLDLLPPALTLERYRELIARFYGIYLPLEREVLSRAPGHLSSFFSARQKVPALLADLAALDLSPDAVPVCDSLPPLQSFPHLLGASYVMEGATLGGQIISRHLSAHLGIGRDNGGAFFHGYGSQTGGMWTAFRTCLLHHSSPANDDAVVEGASHTFHAMHRWLCRERPSN